MKLPIMNEPLALPLDIRDDENTSTTFDALDDSIPIVEGVPTKNTFSMARRTFLRGMSFYMHGGPSTIYDHRSYFSLVVHVCATAHLTNWVW